MAARPRELGDFNGVGHFVATFWVECTFRAYNYGALDTGMVIILQLCR